MSNTFGQYFRVSTWGESHGASVGCVIDGCPAGIALSEDDIQPAMNRRRPGQSVLVTPRDEKDRIQILSGVFDGQTLGTPIAMALFNKDVDSSKYENMRNLYRPSHADYTYDAKHGYRDWRGGGRTSARETAARVAAGALAEKILAAWFGVEIVGWVSDVAHVTSEVDPSVVTREAVDANPVRCPDEEAAAAMEAHIREVRKEKDSVGGCVRCVVRGLPAGIGEPVFDRLEATLAHAMLSLPASKGFEFGSGFAGTLMKGSQHNDPFEMREGKVRTRTNHSGGIQGGISNGEDIGFRVAFKPVATIFQEQDTVTDEGEATSFAARGRHDPCVLPRAVPIVEAMTSLVLLDAVLAQRALYGESWGRQP